MITLGSERVNDKLVSVQSDIRKTWSIIRQVLTKKLGPHQSYTMKDSNGTYTDPVQIANKFNNFFTNIGPSLATNIPCSQTDYRKFLTGYHVHSFFLRPTSVAEVSSIASSIKNSFNEGVDNISTCILPLKESIDLLAAPLAYICNSSFSEGKFPEKLKIAKILPVYKSDDKLSFTNYRLISILEKLFHSRLLEFLTKFNILNHHQYDFRQHHSTYSIHVWLC